MNRSDLIYIIELALRGAMEEAPHADPSVWAQRIAAALAMNDAREALHALTASEMREVVA